jgi:hypothetical protein
MFGIGENEQKTIPRLLRYVTMSETSYLVR